MASLPELQALDAEQGVELARSYFTDTLVLGPPEPQLFSAIHDYGRAIERNRNGPLVLEKSCAFEHGLGLADLMALQHLAG